MISQIPTVVAISGLAALAGIFFLLQRLRVRQKPITVETTLFWKDAVEDARARVFVQRFRHPWVYLLLLFIGTLLWLGFAGLRTEGNETGRQVVLIDASANMLPDDRFAESLQVVDDFVVNLPPDSRWVIVCSDRPRTILRPGENVELMRKRLEGVRPAACPPILADVISTWSKTSDQTTRFCVSGSEPLAQGFLQSLPENVAVKRIDESKLSAEPERKITNLGFSPARSGDWAKVDVLVEMSSSDPIVSQPIVSLGRRTLTTRPDVVMEEKTTKFYFRGISALGEELEVEFSDRTNGPSKSIAKLWLPDRRPIAISLAPDLPAPLLQALRSDPGIAEVKENSKVVVRMMGSDFGGDLPAFEISSESTQADTILAIHEADELPTVVLTRLFQELGLSEIDASDLARTNGARVTMGASPGTTRKLLVWNSLFSNDFNFTKSRAFPLFVGKSMRWLSGFVPTPTNAAVGEELVLEGSLVSNSLGQRFDTLNDTFRPTQVGQYETPDGVQFWASYLADDSKWFSDSQVDPEEAGKASTFGSLVSILLVIALIAILGEWILYRLGRIP